MTDTIYTPVALDDLGVMPVDITIKTPYGRVVKMRVKPLTCSRWTEVGMQVADPPRPATENPATMRVWNEYRAKADDERAYRRVIEAVEGGGNPVPGTTPSEKVENWRRIVDQGIHNSILRFLVQVVVGDQKSVYADADRFLQEDGVDSSEL